MEEPAAKCAVTCRVEGGRLVLAIAGELDLATAKETEQVLHACRDRYGEHLVLDLTSLTFVDSSGLSVLARLLTAAEGRGGSAVIAGPLDVRVARIMRVTHLDRQVRIHPSLPAALASPLPPLGTSREQ
ncbi:STAS domain-containing protein [Actinomadura fibrosa]|uniref:Anti-sigma factor antagonist n=1 Tax=Actinomadura fibrosa TaxID=111802 RepID=A0ABW2XDI6_9ACTN|nr:STAS domain-containing protein [Actinomadura fibrosa]